MTGPLPTESQSGWVCIHFKTMWALYVEFPENSAVSSVAPTPTGFCSQNLWGFIFLVLEPWAVWSGLGLGSLIPKIFLPNFYLPHMNVGPPVPVLLLPPSLCATLHLLASLPHLCVSAPPTCLYNCDYFKSLVDRLPYSSIFSQFWVFFVLRFSCNSVCGCARRQSVPTYSSILTESLK